MKKIAVAILVLGCTKSQAPLALRAIGDNSDPAPALLFSQQALAVGLLRSNEPASSTGCAVPGPSETLAYGTWLADFDGDGDLDVYGVNHGQSCRRSGLWLNQGNGTFGQNTFNVAVKPATQNGANLGLSNEMMFVGDLTGDGKVDLYFLSWSGYGAMCVNQGNTGGSDWSGPSFRCYSAWAPQAFGDVDNDGRIDVLTIASTGSYNTYRHDYSHSGAYVWRLNNGNPNPNSWPTTTTFAALRPSDPNVWTSPVFVDLNLDGYPDKVIGIDAPSGSGNPPNGRGGYLTQTAGHQVYLGQSDGSYVVQSGTGLENAYGPFVRVEDVNDDGCPDMGYDITGYKDNHSWYVQGKQGGSCTVTFVLIPRTALPYHPGGRRYTADVDNSGTMDKVVINLDGFGNGDGFPGGINLWRKLPSGSYQNVPPSVHGADIGSWFYASQLNPGDWNGDGKLDMAGAGHSALIGTDLGFGLWTSSLSTGNNWIKVALPTVTGFFTGSARVEIFEAEYSDAAHLVTPPLVLRTGRAWASQVYHFGVGQRQIVDIKVTFPDGTVGVYPGLSALQTVTLIPGGSAESVDAGEPDAPIDAPPPTVSVSTVTFVPSVSPGTVSVEWSLDGVLTTSTTPPFSFQAAVGPHVVTAKACNAGGACTTSQAVTLGVQ